MYFGTSWTVSISPRGFRGRRRSLGEGGGRCNRYWRIAGAIGAEIMCRDRVSSVRFGKPVELGTRNLDHWPWR